jgi:hypothetical protein
VDGDVKSSFLENSWTNSAARVRERRDATSSLGETNLDRHSDPPCALCYKNAYAEFQRNVDRINTLMDMAHEYVSANEKLIKIVTDNRPRRNDPAK